MALLNKYGNPINITWEKTINPIYIFTTKNKTNNIYDGKVISGNEDSIIDELCKIANDDVKEPFTYKLEIKDPISYDLILGEFFWALADKLTNNAEYDENLSQLTDEIYDKIHQYFLSIGWVFRVIIYDDLIEYKIYEINPKEYVVDYMDMVDIMNENN